ncbi:MAG TPA: DUF2299 family protein [Thermodesulfobacteriota bacterium]|nr:DUF2299 family protein [Thermodesulfobacteriota bacterium]
MSVSTAQEAQEKIGKWLKENGHQVKLIEDTNSNFHFEIDYPLGTLKRQRIIQPKEYPDLIVLLNGVAVADEHKHKMKAMSEEERDRFYGTVKKDLMFVDNSYDMNVDGDGVVQQVQFSYEFYMDSLTKTNLFKGLLLNHRTLIYIVTVFNEKFGVPQMPVETRPSTQTVQ